MASLMNFEPSQGLLRVGLKINVLLHTLVVYILSHGLGVKRGTFCSSVVRHLPLVLEVPGSIPARGEENFGVRTRFLWCHLQG